MWQSIHFAWVNVATLWLGSVLGACVVFFTQVLLLRALGPANFGMFAAALATVAMAVPLAGFGVSGFWLKAFGQEGWHAVRWIRGSLLYMLVSTGVVLFAMLVWAYAGPHDAYTRSLLTALTAYLLGQVSVELVSAKLQLEERFHALALWQFLPHLLRLVLVAAIASSAMSSSGIAYANAYSAVSICILTSSFFMLFSMYCGRWALKGHASSSAALMDYPVLPASLSQVAAKSLPFGLAGVFYLIYFQSVIVMLKYMNGDEAAGVYSVAFMVMTAVYMFPGVIYQKFLLPKMHRWSSHNSIKLKKFHRMGTSTMFGGGTLAMILIWIFADLVLPVIAGNQYEEAISILMILAIAAPFRFMSLSAGAFLATGDRINNKIYIMGGVALTNIGLNLALISTLGLTGAAIATVLTEVSLAALYLYHSKAISDE